MIDIANYEDVIFPVTEVPIPLPQMPNNSYILDSGYGDDSQFKMIVREDTGEPISVMSKDYRLVSNQDLLMAALPHLNKFGAVMANDDLEMRSNHVFGNARSQFSFDFPLSEIAIAKGDDLHPRLTLINSYDGTKRVGFKYGAFRLVCSNGMMIGDAKTETYMHIGARTELDDIGNIIERAVGNMQEMLGEKFGPLLEQNLEMHKISKLIEMFPKVHRGPMYAQIQSQNAWDVYNAVTFMTTHMMDSNKESTHKLESDAYRFIKRNAA
ncbi:MAG: DUF932 domain-containing protein [Candidatus Scalindua sp.]|jgi:hypothetical protein|nr:DUF932 domain-containing protein [Candidatus Scalindua sp.]